MCRERPPHFPPTVRESEKGRIPFILLIPSLFTSSALPSRKWRRLLLTAALYYAVPENVHVNHIQPFQRAAHRDQADFGEDYLPACKLAPRASADSRRSRLARRRVIGSATSSPADALSSINIKTAGEGGQANLHRRNHLPFTSSLRWSMSRRKSVANNQPTSILSSCRTSLSPILLPALLTGNDCYIPPSKYVGISRHRVTKISLRRQLRRQR